MPMPKVENFCGGVQVTIIRTKFIQMTNVGSDVGGDVGGPVGDTKNNRTGHRFYAESWNNNP